jgi:hypothetical protein
VQATALALTKTATIPLELLLRSRFMDNLPPELLFSVFAEVDFSEYSPYSLINVASVCGRWRDVVYSQPSLWTALTIPAHIAPQHEHGASQDQALLST